MVPLKMLKYCEKKDSKILFFFCKMRKIIERNVIFMVFLKYEERKYENKREHKTKYFSWL